MVVTTHTLFRGFVDALRERGYKKSTIEQYTTSLRESNIELNDLEAVRAKAKRLLEDDFHGDVHRAFLCYSTYLDGEELPGGRGPNRNKTTLNDACLRQTSRDAIRKIVWLVNHHRKAYAVDTAIQYTMYSRRSAPDMHGHFNRAHVALKEYPKHPWTPNFTDLGLASEVKEHYYKLKV